jgi:hypothetical protein
VKLIQKLGLVMLEQDVSTLNAETLFVDDDSTDRTNAGEDCVLSLIGINVLELQMRNVLRHG